MKIACAECGCVVDAGIRVNVCTDSGCCCAELPTAPEPERVEGPDTPACSREETDGRWRREELYDRQALSSRRSG